MSDDLDDKLQLLKKSFIDGLPDRAANIAKLAQQDPTQLSSTEITTLQTEVHKIAGIAPLYGFDKLAQAAKDVDLHILENMSNESQIKSDEFASQMSLLYGRFNDAIQEILD